MRKGHVAPQIGHLHSEEAQVKFIILAALPHPGVSRTAQNKAPRQRLA